MVWGRELGWARVGAVVVWGRELGWAGVGAVRGLGLVSGRAGVWGRVLGRAGWWCVWSGRWGVGRARVGLVGGVRGGALGRDGGEAILIRRRKSTFVDIFKGNGKEISRPATRSKL